MKVLWRLPWAALVLGAPSIAAAQATVTVSDETSDARLSNRPRQTITLTTGATATSSGGVVPEFHTVSQGDTLWEITGYYFQNPWHWPRVWARNPQITNPHWIFPGDQVRLLLPGEVSITTPRVSAPGPARPRNRLELGGPRYPRGTVFLREEAWATDEDIASSGAIVGAPEDSMLLSEGDQVYVEFQRRAPNVGESYTIYHEAQDTRGSDRNAGRVVRVLGTLLVDAWDSQRHVATGRITESLDTIERGERVAVVQRQFQPVPPTTNDRDIAGHVVATPSPRTIVGGQYVVIVDRGERDGVRLGNRFFLTQRGDPWRNSVEGYSLVARNQEIDRDGDGHADAPPDANQQRARDQLPVEVTGEMIVIAVHPRTAVCLVSLSQREVEVGQPVVMRRGY